MARSVLPTFARTLGNRLDRYDFQADRYMFRRYNAEGDAVIVGVHSQRSYHGDARFDVKLAFVLAPHWQWAKERDKCPPAQEPDTMHASWSSQVRATDELGDLGIWVIKDESGIEPLADIVFGRLQSRLATVLPWLDRDELRRVADDRTNGLLWHLQKWHLTDPSVHEPGHEV